VNEKKDGFLAGLARAMGMAVSSEHANRPRLGRVLMGKFPVRELGIHGD